MVFYHSEEQKNAADEWLDKLLAAHGRKLATQVIKSPAFYMAEGYHQQYYVNHGVAACPI